MLHWSLDAACQIKHKHVDKYMWRLWVHGSLQQATSVLQELRAMRDADEQRARLEERLARTLTALQSAQADGLADDDFASKCLDKVNAVLAAPEYASGLSQLVMWRRLGAVEKKLQKLAR